MITRETLRSENTFNDLRRSIGSLAVKCTKDEKERIELKIKVLRRLGINVLEPLLEVEDESEESH